MEVEKWRGGKETYKASSGNQMRGKCGGETKRVLRKNSRDKGHSQLNIIKAWLFKERAILKGIMVRLIPETLTFTDTENMWVVVWYKTGPWHKL